MIVYHCSCQQKIFSYDATCTGIVIFEFDTSLNGVGRPIELLYTHQFALLDTVNSTECDPIFWITTLWFSDSVSPLSETDDVVHIK